MRAVKTAALLGVVDLLGEGVFELKLLARRQLAAAPQALGERDNYVTETFLVGLAVLHGQVVNV